MKSFYLKSLLILSASLLTDAIYAQVGVGTTSPQAQFEVKSTNQATPANTDGMLIPKADAFPATNPTSTQQGMLLYLTTATTFLSTSRQPGFYYWNNPTSDWIGISSTANGDHDWYEVGTTTAPDAITDDMFHLGNVAIGKNTTGFPLDIQTTTGTKAINNLVNNSTNGTDKYGIDNTVTGTSTDNQYGIKNTISNTANGVHYGTYNDLNSSGTGAHYANYNVLGGTGNGQLYGNYANFSNTGNGTQVAAEYILNGNGNGLKYGTSVSIFSAGTGDHYGAINRVSGNGSGFHYGVVNTLGGSGTGQPIGVYNQITSSTNANSTGIWNTISGTGTGAHFGVDTTLSGTGTGQQTGSSVAITNSGNGIHLGFNSQLIGNGTGTHTGLNNLLSGSGSGVQNGVINSITTTGAGDNLGISNLLSGTGNGNQYGSYNIISNTGIGLHYGSYNVLSGNGFNGHTGTYNLLSGSSGGVQTGTYNEITNTAGSSHYGATSVLSGTGAATKYGFNAYIDPFAGGTHYGVYSEVLKAGTTNFAGYFLGNVGIGTTTANTYTFPPSRGTNNQIMITNGTGAVTWQNASAIQDHDWYEVGTTLAPDAITDNMFHTGNVAIGKNTANFPLDITSTTRTINSVSTTGTTAAVFGFNTTASGAGAGGHGIAGQTSQSGGSGARGEQLNAAGIGVSGINFAASGASSGSGVYGQSTQSAGFGLVGVNNHASGTGILGSGQNQTGLYLVAGSGGAFTGLTTGAYAKSTTAGVSEALYTDNFGSITRVNYWSGTTLYKIIGTGTVSTTAKDLNDNRVTLHCTEAPEILFEDYGQGQLTNGRVHVEIDPIIAKNITVNERHPLRVFIQLEDECNGVYVTNKTGNSFDVVELASGHSNAKFQYRIVGNRADEVQPDGRISKNADTRFEPAPRNMETKSTTTFEEKPTVNGQQ